MKTTFALTALLLAVTAFSCSSKPTRSPYPTSHQSKVEYDSASLMMMNAEQMNGIVLKKIKKAQDIQKRQEVDDDRGISAEPEAIAQLQDATRLVLARPDQDGSREHTFARLRRELSDLNSFDEVLKNLTKEGIESLKNPDRHSPREQATYIVLLENLIAEIKPESRTNPAFKKVIENIRDADIEISDEVRSQQLIRSMNKPISPSETARKILSNK